MVVCSVKFNLYQQLNSFDARGDKEDGKKRRIPVRFLQPESSCFKVIMVRSPRFEPGSSAWQAYTLLGD